MKHLTVYERIHEGARANEARDKINAALDDAHISTLMRISILDLMATELKMKTVR